MASPEPIRSDPDTHCRTLQCRLVLYPEPYGLQRELCATHKASQDKRLATYRALFSASDQWREGERF